jgi:beta-N-acetylhexosaminidase
VAAFEHLHPKDHPSNVMVAFDTEGKQVAWTLMLSPQNRLLQKIWAFPSLCGSNTGLIGCVGVDEAHRGSGIGLALMCHAILDMKQRGIQGIFVDFTEIAQWYEKVGFNVWREYQMWEI